MKNATTKTHISNGNIKLGSIPNFSLTPGRTCSKEACRTCLIQGCYACKAYRQYKNTRAAWDDNTEKALNDLDGLENDLNKYFSAMSAPRFFRIHTGGDFVTREYAETWARVAAANPHTNFLAFTKQWDNVRGVEFPENFSLVLSAWTEDAHEIPLDLKLKYSIAYCIDDEMTAPENAVECPGNCSTCGACWSLSKMHTNVYFHKH